MRLDAFVSRFGDFSRSESRRIVRSNRVSLNGVLTNDPSTVVNEKDTVVVDGKPIEAFDNVYVALNKPAGYVCSRERSEGRSVFELIDANFSADLSIGGRLDKDATGLLILSNDGMFIHEVISPRKNVEKEYLVETAEEITENEVSMISGGLFIGNNEFSKPVHVEVIDHLHMRIILTEGRYHEVKRLVSASGNRVINLHRRRIGYYCLSEELRPGEWKLLSENDRKKITGT
ncbi:MAG: rRNA pseudouridine synthase [Kosmotogaceae bacterium]|nr:rRNA pseudouridine synthase [Kosmotogaceae bacterium]